MWFVLHRYFNCIISNTDVIVTLTCKEGTKVAPFLVCWMVIKFLKVFYRKVEKRTWRPWSQKRVLVSMKFVSLTTARHRYVFRVTRIKSTPPRAINLTSILILSSLLRLGLPSSHFPSVFPTNIVYPFLISIMRVTCPAHVIFIDLTTVIILGEGPCLGYQSSVGKGGALFECKFGICIFPQSPANSSV
jgi:hypothetical protein